MRREQLKRLAARVPPFTSPRVRDRTVRAVRAARRRRRLIYERFGSTRWSRPGLHGLDRRLEPYLPPDRGFFVEAGANDGYHHSNTYFLERFRGWTGILIEPIPELHRRCLRERPRSLVVNCALVAADGPAEVPMTYHHLTSAVDPPAGHEEGGDWDREYELTVPARTISSVLDCCAAPEVDLLSLDVEGYELEALRGLDLERHGPRLVLVEANAGYEGIEALLGERYERLASLPPNDVLYRRRDP